LRRRTVDEGEHMADGRQPGAAIVGTGFGVLTHLRALRGAGFAVHALVGRDPDKTARKAGMFDVAHPTTDLAEALAVPGVDVVAVATPPYTHGPIVLEAVAAGKHVVCEKPFARDVTEARAMRDAAVAAGVVHALGTEFRYGTGQALLARTIAAGEIGTPRLGIFQLQLPTLADPKAELPAWWEDAAEGGGWLGAYGSHVIDQIRWTFGEFEAVSASLQTLAPRPAMTADDTYTIQFRLRSGFEGVMHSSCAVGGQFLGATKVTGTAGAAWLEGDDVWVDDGTGPRQIPVPDELVSAAPVPPPAELLHTAYDMWHSMGIDLDPYTRLYADVREQMAGRPRPAGAAGATFDDGVAVQAVMDAVHRSAAERSWITVE
jgi:predicted dehydrogenase